MVMTSSDAVLVQQPLQNAQPKVKMILMLGSKNVKYPGVR